ncbi:MAG: hypothetical protein ACT4N4_00525 [Rhodospirillales bacterium]
MLRSEIRDGLQRIIRVLGNDAVTGMAKAPPDRDIFLDMGTQAFETIITAYKSFSDSEKKIFLELGLDDLKETKWWSSLFRLLNDETREREKLFAVRRVFHRCNLATEILPQLLRIFEQEVPNGVTEGPVSKQRAYLTIVLPEPPELISSLRRVREMFKAVDQLYNALSTLREAKAEPLALVRCDSRSDQSFDFLGAKDIIMEMRLFVVELFDRLAFFKQRKLIANLDGISKSMSVLDDLKNAQDNGTISPEQAEILKRAIVGAADALLETGAITPEMVKAAAENRLELVKPGATLMLPKPGSSHLDQDRKQRRRRERMPEKDTEGDIGKKSPSRDANRKIRRLEEDEED